MIVIPVSDLITGMVLFNRLSQKIISESTAFSLTQYRVLFYLSICSEGHRRIRDIARTLHLSASAVSAAATELEEEGLIERFRPLKDLKAVGLRITEKGNEALSLAAQTHFDEYKFYWDIIGEHNFEGLLQHMDVLFEEETIDETKARDFDKLKLYPFFSRWHLSAYIDRFKTTYNLRFLDTRILILLLESQEPMDAATIGRLLNESSSSISTATRYLYRVRKLITRDQEQGDKRQVRISLNERGREIAQELLDCFISQFQFTLHLTQREFEAIVLSRVASHPTLNIKESVFAKRLATW